MVFTNPSRPSQLSQRTTADNFLATQSAYIVAASSASSIGFTNPSGNQPVTIKFYNSNTTAGDMAYICCSNSAASGGAVAAIASTTNPTYATQLFNAGQGNQTSYSISNCDALGAGSILTQDYPPGTNTISVISQSAAYTSRVEFSIGYGQQIES